MSTRILVSSPSGGSHAAVVIQRNSRFGSDANRLEIRPGDDPVALELSDVVHAVILAGKPVDPQNDDPVGKVSVIVEVLKAADATDEAPAQAGSTTGVLVHTRSTKTGRDEEGEELKGEGDSYTFDLETGTEGVVTQGAPFAKTTDHGVPDAPEPQGGGKKPPKAAAAGDGKDAAANQTDRGAGTATDDGKG